MAAALKSDWIAIHLKTGDREDMSRSQLRRAEKALRLAERLGATTVSLNAKDMSAEILDYAKKNNITQIVIGRPERNWFTRWFARSLPRDLLDRARDIAVTLVTPKDASPPEPWFTWPTPHVAVPGIAAAILAVTASVIIGLLLERIITLPNLPMVFLFAVLLCAIKFGVWSAVTAAGLSFLAYNFFFIDPRYDFTVAEPYELFSLLIFLVVAVATGGLAGRLREQATATHERAEATQSLYDFSRKLSGAAGLDDVIWLLAAQSAAIVKGKSVILLVEGGQLQVRGGWPPEDQLSTSDWAAARWAHERGETAGRMTGTLPSALHQFRPLTSSQVRFGVIGIEPGGDAGMLSAATEGALQSFIDQAAIAIERTMLVEKAAKTASAAETERLRAALLSSISHDLRTPLASIIGSVTSLRQLGDRMPRDDQVDLLATIEEEAGRLSRFVSNLLDMTRLEAGALDIRRDWVDVGDAVRSAVARAKKSFPQRRIDVKLDDRLPLVRGDATLLEQVVFNLLDNAHKYSGPKSATAVVVRAAGRSLELAVNDDGVGIPAEALEKVFDKFYRVAGSDGRAAGTGLGLSICAGLVRGMGGDIRAESPISRGRGTRIIVSFPLEPAGATQLADNKAAAR